MTKLKLIFTTFIITHQKMLKYTIGKLKHNSKSLIYSYPHSLENSINIDVNNINNNYENLQIINKKCKKFKLEPILLHNKKIVSYIHSTVNNENLSIIPDKKFNSYLSGITEVFLPGNYNYKFIITKQKTHIKLTISTFVVINNWANYLCHYTYEAIEQFMIIVE